MPNYGYECTKCEHYFEQVHPIAERDKPTTEKCPSCGKAKSVIKSWKGVTPGLSADNTLTPDKASGGRWTELMNRMKSNLPEYAKKRLDRASDMKGTRWK
jgi:putative FmdB family regulatory protein